MTPYHMRLHHRMIRQEKFRKFERQHFPRPDSFDKYLREYGPWDEGVRLRYRWAFFKSKRAYERMKDRYDRGKGGGR